MKKLSFIAVLALSTALTACGGGSSGGGYVPTTTLPTTNGATTPGSGTNIQAVNNTAERSTAYQEAAETVGITAGTNTSDIDAAFSSMEKILIDNDFSSATEEDILMALAMAGEDVSGLKDKTLEELKTEAQDTAIKAAAEDVYAKLGTERVLTLKDVTFYEPSDANRGTYTFSFDKNGNLTGLVMGDEAGVENLAFNRVGEGTYNKKATFVNYGFKFGYHDEEITFDHTPTAAELREAFKKTAKAEWPDASDMDAMLAWIDTVDLTQFDTEDDCDSSSRNCVYKESPEQLDVTLKYNSLGKDIGLKYADFGTTDLTTNSDKEIGVFYGGYEALSASAKDLPQVDTEMNFEGKAVAAVTVEDDYDEKLKTFNGSSALTFKDGKETLITDFTSNGWHKVTIETDTSKSSGYAFTFTGTPTNSDFAVNPSGWESNTVDIKYYGENPKNPDEFVGSAIYEYGTATKYLEAEIGFGGVRKEK